jgi:hypothetical protein
VRRGSLDDAIPDAVLSTAHAGEAPVPALLLIDDADPLANHEALTHTAKSLPRARLSVVHGAPTTTSSTTSSTVRWPPRSSPSWRPCATNCGR